MLALPFDTGHPQRPPAVTQGLGLQACIGLGRGAGPSLVGDSGRGASARPMPPDAALTSPPRTSTGARRLGTLRSTAVEDDFGPPAQLQRIACGKVDEQQTGLGIEQQIAEHVEVQVAGKIRDGQTITFDPDKPGLPTTMGNIHRTLSVRIDVQTGDEEVSALFRSWLWLRHQDRRRAALAASRIAQRHALELAQLNVLGQLPKA